MTQSITNALTDTIENGCEWMSVKQASFKCWFATLALFVTYGVSPVLAGPELDMITLPPVLLDAVSSKPQQRTRTMTLPGHTTPQEVTYKLEDGLAIYDGDIVLGAGDDFVMEQPEPHPTPRDFRFFMLSESEYFRRE